MPFKKGQNGMGGRPKGIKNKQRLIRYSPKEWEKITKHNVYNQAEIEHRLNNNLPIDDIIDIMDEKYSRNKNGDKGV
jgi:hypothetical protein